LNDVEAAKRHLSSYVETRATIEDKLLLLLGWLFLLHVFAKTAGTVLDDYVAVKATENASTPAHRKSQLTTKISRNSGARILCLLFSRSEDAGSYVLLFVLLCCY
jgi:hypothetical protein